MTKSGFAAGQLKSFVERVERLEEDADQVDFHQVGAVAHEAHRIVVADQIHAVADAIGAQQQGFADVRIGFVNFAGVDRKFDRAVLSSQIP